MCYLELVKVDIVSLSFDLVHLLIALQLLLSHYYMWALKSVPLLGVFLYVIFATNEYYHKPLLFVVLIRSLLDLYYNYDATSIDEGRNINILRFIMYQLSFMSNRNKQVQNCVEKCYVNRWPFVLLIIIKAFCTF